jgi:hypothetical protein
MTSWACDAGSVLRDVRTGGFGRGDDESACGRTFRVGNDPDSTSEGSVAAIARVLSDFFAAVSFVDGSKPNYHALRALFSDGAPKSRRSTSSSRRVRSRSIPAR